MEADYYQVLGISRNSNTSEIKSAYRKLALKYHPDQAKNMTQEVAEAQFKRINEAYQVLSDPSKKSHYDRFGKQGLNFVNKRQSGVYYTSYGSSTSKRTKIEEKLKQKVNFSISSLASELDVSIKNLMKILQKMLEKGMYKGEIINNMFVFAK